SQLGRIPSSQRNVVLNRCLVGIKPLGELGCFLGMLATLEHDLCRPSPVAISGSTCLPLRNRCDTPLARARRNIGTQARSSPWGSDPGGNLPCPQVMVKASGEVRFGRHELLIKQT